MMSKYEKGNSFLHRLDPMSKLVALAAYSISIFFFDSLWFEAACFIAMLLTAYAIKAGSVLSLARSKYIITLSLWLIRWPGRSTS